MLVWVAKEASQVLLLNLSSSLRFQSLNHHTPLSSCKTPLNPLTHFETPPPNYHSRPPIAGGERVKK